MRFLVLASVALLSVAHVVPSPAQAASEWTEDSFEEFRDGEFFDGGSNIYVSAAGRIQIINRWDFNGDGHLDILMPGGHGQTEKENVFIYPGDGVDLDGHKLIEIPAVGARTGLIRDFNKDGLNDLAICNTTNSHYPLVDSFVYYATDQGLTAESRVELPSYGGSGIAAGDFNNDGWVDLAIACQWHEGDLHDTTSPKMSFIYWNGPEGFKPDNRTAISFNDSGAQNFATRDLDRDGIDDLIAMTGNTFIYYSSRKALENSDERVIIPNGAESAQFGDLNGDKITDIVFCNRAGVTIHYGSESGFEPTPNVELKVTEASDCAVADFDADGLDDVFVSSYSTPGGAMWTQSFVYYYDGKDFSSREPLALPTLGAYGVDAGDINGDGFPEIVVCNLRLTNQYNLLSYVYWNDRGKFRFGNHTQLLTRGAQDAAIGDITNDSQLDVVFFCADGDFRDGVVSSHVYWGDGTRNFSRDRSLEFSDYHLYGTGHADLDDSGAVDLIFCRAGFVYQVGHDQTSLQVHWGGDDGFTTRTNLSLDSATGVRVADINRDGWLDLLAGGDSTDPSDPNRLGFTIFWGSPSGFAHRRRLVVPTEKGYVRCPLLMDFNRDGWLDMAAQTKFGSFRIWMGGSDFFSNATSTEFELREEEVLMYLQGADLNRDGWLDLVLPHRAYCERDPDTSFIYYGSKDGFSTDNRAEVASYTTYENSIADLNRDSWLDIILCSYEGYYRGEDMGNHPTLVHWGGPNGFNEKPYTELETYGSSGIESADFDADGWLDLLVSNHREAGSVMKPIPQRHTTNSMVYWGGSDGFSSDERWEFPAVGPSGMNVRDLGNSYDRGLYEDYISSAHEIASGEKPASIVWKAETPHRTAVQFQIRTAANKDGLSAAPWTGPDGPDSWFTESDSAIPPTDGKWIQYRARLTTPNGGPTPYLTSVTLKFK
jgi:hypothetical protein